MRIIIMLLAALALAGCKETPQLPAIISPFKIDVQQGNVVTQEMVGKLKAGQTRSQVRFVLGSPLVTDMFHDDRWDYIYLLQRQGKPNDRRRLTVIFDGDKLLRLEGDVVLTDKEQEPPPPTVKPPAAPVTKPAAPARTAAPPVAKPETAPAPKPAAVNPVVAPSWPAAAKPAATAPAAVPPVAKPEIAPPAKPAVPLEKPAAAETGKPAASQAVPAASNTASTPTADTAKPEAVKTDAKTEAAATKADDKKDAPRQSGFGRMLDKIGF